MNKRISKYWFWSNILFISIAMIYQIIKIFRDSPGVDNQGLNNFTYLSIIFLIAGTVLIIMIYINRYKSVIIKILLLTTGYTFLCFVYILQKDPALKWEGSDVATYNYEAGVEVSELGSCYVISTWNTRANPFDTMYYSEAFTPESKEMFKKEIFKDWMKIITGDRWNTRELLVDKANNRPYMHPPVSPLIIGLWLKIFPFGRYSAEILMIIINLAVFIFLMLKYLKEGTNSSYLLFFALVLSPVTVLFINPSAEHPTMMLSILTIMILLWKDLNNRFLIPLIAGIAAGLAFYSKFMMAFYVIFQIIAFLLMRKRLTIRPFIGFTLGFLAVVIIFSLSGYYFWLTVLTGKVYAQVYINSIRPYTLAEQIQKIMYFGLPLILTIIYMIYKIVTDIKNFENAYIVIPFLLGSIAYIASTWEVGAFNRYLFVYAPALFPFVYNSIKEIEFSKRDVIIVPISCAILLGIILYF